MAPNSGSGECASSTSSRIRRRGRESTRPYFVVLQSHYLEPLDSVIVAPMVRDARRAITVLDVELEFDEERLVLTLGELFSIDRDLLKVVRGSIAQHEDRIRRALERAFTGF